MRIHKIKENQIETVVEIAVNILGQSATDTRSYICDTIKMKNGAVFIAENDYNVLGFIRGTFTSWNKIGNIGLIATVKEARGKSGYVPESYMKDYYKDGIAGINFAKYL